MKQINKSKPVLVTGATGYIAGWLVKRLLEEGITVHAAVRDPENLEKTAHLRKLEHSSPGTIKFFKTDLLKPGSYQEAIKECELVFHTASPFTSNFKDPQRDLIDPAVKGTENVLLAASQTPTVKRVVVTSSCAAIYSDAADTLNAGEGRISENDWNTTASLQYQPYSYSKTLAEKKAWTLAEDQDQWDLVTINPCLVLGPPLNATVVTSESFNILKQMGDGTMKMGAPRIGLGVVDVRDVAEAHFRAGYNPEASGRYITAAHETDIYSMSQELLDRYGDEYPLPKRALPKWLLMIVGPLINKAFSRKFIRNNVNIPWRADNSKIKKELSINFRPLKETMEDSFQAMVDHNLI